MNKFETYLIHNGFRLKVAQNYRRVADRYLEWLKVNKLKATQITKRSQFTEWLQECREQGNTEGTILVKENVIKHYYFFLGTKNNPAISWIPKKKEHTLPASALSKEDLLKVYNSLAPKSPADYRNRCMLGFVLFQGLKRSELEELRIQDIDFENGDVFVHGQSRTHPRRLKLEYFQVLHINAYLLKYRKDLLVNKADKETDRIFLSKGSGGKLNNTITRLIYYLKRDFPHIKNLYHIRGSVITNWQKQEGIIEAMVKAGHRYITSTQRYESDKYNELEDRLKNLHPLERMQIN